MGPVPGSLCISHTARARRSSTVLPKDFAHVGAASALIAEHDARNEAQWVGRQLARYQGTCRIAFAHRGRHVLADSVHRDERAQQRIWEQLRGRTILNLVAHVHAAGRLETMEGVNVLVSGAAVRISADWRPSCPRTTGRR